MIDNQAETTELVQLKNKFHQINQMDNFIEQSHQQLQTMSQQEQIEQGQDQENQQSTFQKIHWDDGCSLDAQSFKLWAFKHLRVSH